MWRKKREATSLFSKGEICMNLIGDLFRHKAAFGSSSEHPRPPLKPVNPDSSDRKPHKANKGTRLVMRFRIERRQGRARNGNLHFPNSNFFPSHSLPNFSLRRLGGGRYSNKQQTSSSDHERGSRKDELRGNKNLSHSQSQNSMTWRTHGSGGILKSER